MSPNENGFASENVNPRRTIADDMPIFRRAGYSQTLKRWASSRRKKDRADSGQLQQALIHLVLNAVNATAPGITVKLSAYAQDSKISTDTENPGIVIPEPEQTLISSTSGMAARGAEMVRVVRPDGANANID